MQVVWINEKQFSNLLNFIGDVFLTVGAILLALNTILSYLPAYDQTLADIHSQQIATASDIGDIKSYTGNTDQHVIEITADINSISEDTLQILTLMNEANDLSLEQITHQQYILVDTKNITEELQNVIRAQQALEELQKEIKQEVISVKNRFNEYLGEESFLLKKQDEILIAIKEFNLVEALNSKVEGMNFDSQVSADSTLDLCEYDPLGFGPIECEGAEILETKVTGIQFL